MTFEEIASLPVRDVAAPDAWLFLWVPGPHLSVGTSPAHRALGLQILAVIGIRLGQAEALAVSAGTWGTGIHHAEEHRACACWDGAASRAGNAKDVRELIVSAAA